MDYFNEDERQKQQEFAAWRDRALKPVISIFTALRLSPNHITILAIILLVIGVSLPVESSNCVWPQCPQTRNGRQNGGPTDHLCTGQSHPRDHARRRT